MALRNRKQKQNDQKRHCVELPDQRTGLIDSNMPGHGWASYKCPIARSIKDEGINVVHSRLAR